MIYVASKSRHATWWKALRQMGLPIVASWLDWAGNRAEIEPTAAEWAAHSEMCLREAANCDVLLLHAQEGESHFGALLECGAALSAGKTVFLVTPHPWPFLRSHPLVQSFDSLDEALRALKT
jgi:hypothetical protein